MIIYFLTKINKIIHFKIKLMLILKTKKSSLYFNSKFFQSWINNMNIICNNFFSLMKNFISKNFFLIFQYSLSIPK